MSLFANQLPVPRIIVVQHSEQAPGGIFCKTLEKEGAQLTVVKPLAGDPLPSVHDTFEGIVVLGGPQHATDDDKAPHFSRLMELMREFDRADKPVAGICLGCQLLARCYGEEPKQLGFLELGFVQHHLTPAAAHDPLFDQEVLPPTMEFHEDTFDLPDGATLLVRGDKCTNQCFKVGNTSYGFQFHLEVDYPTVSNWLKLFQSGEMGHYENYLKDFEQQNLKDMTSNIKARVHDSERFCSRIAARWLTLVNKKRSRHI